MSAPPAARSGIVGRVQPLGAGAPDRQVLARLEILTPGRGFTEITAEIDGFVRRSGVEQGLATLFCRHSSASLVIQENADPDVRADLMSALDRLAPRATAYRHASEGPDDMPAHIRAMLTGVQLAVPVIDGALALGTWQGLYLAEHRDAPHRREVVVHLLGRSAEPG